MRIYMVYDVVVHRRTFRTAQRIDTAHIRQLAPPQMVNAVIVYMVAFGRAVGIAPDPTYRHAAVSEVGYIVMRHVVVRCVEYNHTHGTREDITAMLYDRVVDRNMVRDHIRCRHIRLADLDAVRPQIVQVALPQG